MKTIHRYELPIMDRVPLSMPAGALVLPSPPNPRTNTAIEIWAEVGTDQPPELREFRIIGTGNPVPDDCAQFVGTVFTHGGQSAWHVFEVLPLAERESLSLRAAQRGVS